MTDDLSAEERARRTRLIDEARAVVERLKDVEKQREEMIQSLPPAEISRRLTPACADDAVARWAADADERERERRMAERELKREARRDRILRRRYAQPAAATPAGDDWNVWADARIDARLEEERKMVMDIVGECFGELLAKEREATAAAIRDQVRELKIEATSLRSEVIELRTLLAVERGKVVDQNVGTSRH